MRGRAAQQVRRADAHLPGGPADGRPRGLGSHRGCHAGAAGVAECKCLRNALLLALLPFLVPVLVMQHAVQFSLPYPAALQVGILLNNAGAFYEHPDYMETLDGKWVEGHLWINCLAPTMVRQQRWQYRFMWPRRLSKMHLCKEGVSAHRRVPVHLQRFGDPTTVLLPIYPLALSPMPAALQKGAAAHEGAG